jgi:ribosomal protein S11
MEVKYNKNELNIYLNKILEQKKAAKKMSNVQSHIQKKLIIFSKLLEKIYYKYIYQLSILNTENNTHVSLMKIKNSHVIAKTSAGASGYKRLEKSTRYATYKTTLRIIKIAKKQGVIYTIVKLKGFGKHYKTLKSLLNKNFKIIYLLDNNKYSHNGCKIRKKPRK